MCRPALPSASAAWSYYSPWLNLCRSPQLKGVSLRLDLCVPRNEAGFKIKSGSRVVKKRIHLLPLLGLGSSRTSDLLNRGDGSIIDWRGGPTATGPVLWCLRAWMNGENWKYSAGWRVREKIDCSVSHHLYFVVNFKKQEIKIADDPKKKEYEPFRAGLECLCTQW